MTFFKFDIVSLALNPYVLMLAAIVTGLLLGKIKLGKFSFGTSGALFTGLAIGWAAYRLAQKIYAQGDTQAAGMKAAIQIIETNGERLSIHTFLPPHL